jgi:hypothetical protein
MQRLSAKVRGCASAGDDKARADRAKVPGRSEQHPGGMGRRVLAVLVAGSPSTPGKGPRLVQRGGLAFQDHLHEVRDVLEKSMRSRIACK